MRTILGVTGLGGLYENCGCHTFGRFVFRKKIVGVTGFRGLWELWASQVFAVCGHREGVAYLRNKLAKWA